jgi:signal transduction histidine kinase
MATMLFPIRLKIMIALLLALTAVVIAITFTMASFFHEDKQSYINDWTSIAVLSTAQEARSLLAGYRQQLDTCALILVNDKIGEVERGKLLKGAFDNFVPLVGLTLYRNAVEAESVTDEKSLAIANVTPADLRRYRDANPLPFEDLLAGQVWVRNSTVFPSLPTLDLAFVTAAGKGSTPVIVRGTIRLDALQELGGRFKVFEITLADASGTLLAHPKAPRVAAHEHADSADVALRLAGTGRAGVTHEFMRGATPMLGGFADVGFAGLTASAIIPRSAAYLASRTLLSRLLIVTIVILLLVALGGRLWAGRITKPLERLSAATRTIGQGRFDIHVDVQSRDEIGALSGSFNQMAGELVARESALQNAQAQLIQSEKMAAFGQLGAGIAHEVKNPLTGILGCAELAKLDTPEGTPLHKNLTLIEKETRRCKMIIENLLKFARQEKAILEPTDLNAVVRDAAAITNHQLELSEVHLVLDLGTGVGLVQASGNQLQQVLMNLIVNAQQALKGAPGTVTVATRSIDGDSVEVSVADTGPGIPKEIQAKVFEPFFTTKPTGQGTGLGLSVSFGIVKDHAGEISIDSEPGRGATFRIVLPALRIPARKEAEAVVPA